MIKGVVVLLLIALFSPRLGFAAGPAVLIEEVGPPKSANKARGWTPNERPVSQSQSLKEIYVGQEFTSASEMRSRRRVGIGVSTLGEVGLAGALIELNFAPENSAVIGYGGGPKYNAISFDWKHIFGGQAVSPYMSLGFAHWYNSNDKGGSLNKSTPDFLAGRYLSDEEKRTGRFSKDFFVPSVGLQYNQLVGPYVGTAFFVQVVLMMEASDLSPIPTGSLGALYYF